MRDHSVLAHAYRSEVFEANRKVKDECLIQNHPIYQHNPDDPTPFRFIFETTPYHVDGSRRIDVIKLYQKKFAKKDDLIP